MYRSILFLALASFLISCNPPNDSSGSKPRVASVTYQLGMTHNSHLGRFFSSPANSYSAVVFFEFGLSEATNIEDIYGVKVEDDEKEGWEFTKEEVLAAFNEENNSLNFGGYELRKFDKINKIFNVRLLNEEGDSVYNRGFELDNDFPLPAETELSYPDDSTVRIHIDFYESSYDGGNMPFPLTIYYTYYSSNTFYIVWLDSDGNTLSEDYIDKNNLVPASNPNSEDIYHYDYARADIPEGAASVYTVFRRGGWSSGGFLNTQILELE